MTVMQLTDALIFLRKINKYWKKNFCQDIWDVYKCGDGDCVACPLIILNHDVGTDSDMWGLCARGFIETQIWKLEKCTATITPVKEEYETSKDEEESEDGE